MKKSEVLKQVIALAFDSDPGDVEVTLMDALDLYAHIVREEDSVLTIDTSGLAVRIPPP